MNTETENEQKHPEFPVTGPEVERFWQDEVERAQQTRRRRFDHAIHIEHAGEKIAAVLMGDEQARSALQQS